MRRMITVVALLSISAGGVLAFRSVDAPSGPGLAAPGLSDAERIARLLNELSVTDIDSLPALPVESFVLP